jgi:oligoribonuclease
MLANGQPPGSSLGKMLAWMDLEMTGLDPERHVILEVAMIVTDDDLHIVAEAEPLILQATEAQLAEMDKVVQEMHATNGLLDEVRASELTLAEAEQRTLKFLKQWCPNHGQVPLCGNSIGTDRRFLARYMPQVEGWLHYRSVDVSSLKELAKRWYPPVLAGLPQKDSHHRALEDIRDSIDELRYYRTALFRPEASGPPEPVDPRTIVALDSDER